MQVCVCVCVREKESCVCVNKRGWWRGKGDTVMCGVVLGEWGVPSNHVVCLCIC